MHCIHNKPRTSIVKMSCKCHESPVSSALEHGGTQCELQSNALDLVGTWQGCHDLFLSQIKSLFLGILIALWKIYECHDDAVGTPLGITVGLTVGIIYVDGYLSAPLVVTQTRQCGIFRAYLI